MSVLVPYTPVGTSFCSHEVHLGLVVVHGARKSAGSGEPSCMYYTQCNSSCTSALCVAEKHYLGILKHSQGNPVLLPLTSHSWCVSGFILWSKCKHAASASQELTLAFRI